MNRVRVVRKKTNWTLVILVLIMAALAIYFLTDGDPLAKKAAPTEGGVSDQQALAQSIALYSQLQATQQASAGSTPGVSDPALVAALLDALLGQDGNTSANGTTNPEGTEVPVEIPPSKTVTISYVSPSGDPAELTLADRGSSVLNIRDVAIQISSLNYLEAYGASESGVDTTEAINLIAPNVYGFIASKIVPKKPVEGLQQVEGVNIKAWVATATDLLKVMTPENYQTRKIFIPPGYRDTEEFASGRYFYTPQAAEEWAQSLVKAEGQLVGGQLQGEMGIEITMKLQLCHFTIFDQKSDGELGNGPSGIAERALNLLTAINSLGLDQAFESATALTEAEQLAWSALKSPENIAQAYETGHASWQPGGASYTSEVNRARLMGYSHVVLQVEVTSDPQEECGSTIFGRGDETLLIPGK